MQSAHRRNIQLDVLRGIAILLVFGRHLELPRPGGALGALAGGWYQIGWLGVDLFFVLSGFLIGGLLLSEVAIHGKINVPRFYARRGLKIYPPYLVFLAYLILVPVGKEFLKEGDPLAVLAANWSAYWPNFLFLQNYVGSNPAGHTWTLAVEEHFYLLLPLLMVVLCRVGRIRLILPVCLAVAAGCLMLRGISIWFADPYSVKMSASHLRLDALLFGVGLRAAAEFYPQQFSAARRWRPVLLVTGVLCWAPNLFVEPGSPMIRTVGVTGTFVGAAAFVTAFYHTRANDFGKGAQLVSPVASVIAWIGVYSYAIYLWHVTIMGILERELGGRLLSWVGSGNSWWWMITATGVCAGAVFWGVLTAKLVEWPVLRLRDRFFPSRSKPLPGAGTATPVPVADVSQNPPVLGSTVAERTESAR